MGGALDEGQLPLHMQSPDDITMLSLAVTWNRIHWQMGDALSAAANHMGKVSVQNRDKIT